MTKFLASVRSAEEARLALAGGADIIDAKEPSQGALGRVPDEAIRAIVAEVSGKRPVSATIGDMALEPALILDAVRGIAATGVDIVKIGIFPGDAVGTLSRLEAASQEGIRLVAVLFADRRPDLGLLDHCAGAGFYGAMLDTADKSSGPLLRHCDVAALGAFVGRAHALNLAAGLAGALRPEDVASLARLGPDYLGFRSALTSSGRDGVVSAAAIATIRDAIDATEPVAVMV